jgi:polyphosphate kinase
MLTRTHTAVAPWRVVRADNKRLARLNLIRDVLSRLHYAGRKDKLVRPDTDIVFEFSPDCLEAGRLAR